MNRFAIAAAVAVFALSAMPNASEASHRRHHHHRHHHAAVAAAPADCFLTRMVDRVAKLVLCRT